MKKLFSHLQKSGFSSQERTKFNGVRLKSIQRNLRGLLHSS